MGAVIVFLCFEIMSFTLIAMFIWIFFSVDRWKYTDRKVSNVINKLLHFVASGSTTNNDKIIRILSINYAYESESMLGKYILDSKESDTMHSMS